MNDEDILAWIEERMRREKPDESPMRPVQRMIALAEYHRCRRLAAERQLGR